MKYGAGVGSTHKKIKNLNEHNANSGKAQTGAIAFTKLLARETTNPLTGNYAGALSNAKTAVRLKSQSPSQDLIRMENPSKGNLRSDEQEELTKTKKKATTTNTKTFLSQ